MTRLDRIRCLLPFWLTACSPAVLGQQVIQTCPAGATIASAVSVDPASKIPQGPISLKTIGQIGGSIKAVAVGGIYAYVGVGAQLVVLNVSDPHLPQLAGSSKPFPGAVRDITLAGNYAYVAAGSAGLYIVDVSDPSLPSIVGNHATPGFAESVVVSGRYAYVADGPGGLRVIDIASPANPAEVATVFAMNDILGVAVVGNRAFLAAGGAGLLIADIEVPTSPIEIARLGTAGYTYGVAAAGQTVYLADGWSGLRVVDVTDPAMPTEVGNYQTAGWAMNLVVDGSTLYAATANGGIRILNVANRTLPVDLGGLPLPNGHAQRVAVNGTTAFVADRRLGLHVVDVSDAGRPVRVGLYDPTGFADGVAVADSYAYVAADRQGLRVMDISNRGQPREVAAVVPTENLAGNTASNLDDFEVVTVAGGFAYVSTFRQLFVVDISDPAHPKSSGYTWDQVSWGNASIRSLAIRGGVLVVANEWGLRLLNISDPRSPCELSFLKAAGGNFNLKDSTATGVALSGNFAYVAGGPLWVVDISDPRNPTKVAEFQDVLEGQQSATVSAEDVAVSGSLAYVVGSYYGGARLRVVDISDPKNPKGRGSYPIPPGAHGWGPYLAVAGTTVFVAAGGAGLHAVDARTPDQLQLAGRLGGPASAVVVDSNYVYVAGEDSGLLVIEATADKASIQAARMRVGSAIPAAKTLSRRSGSIARTETPFAYRQDDGAKRRPSQIATPEFPQLSSGTSSGRSKFRRYASSGKICVVTNVADSGNGTLRQCLEQGGAGDTITFDPIVFPPATASTIKVVTPLPRLSSGGVTIDGSNSGVILDGSSAPPGTDGISIYSDGNTVIGLQIGRFSGNGVRIAGASDNTIGGDRSRGVGPSGEGNVIIGNQGSGIGLSVGPPYDTVCGCWTNSGNNRIVGNFVGLDVTGTKTLGNGMDGVSVQSNGNTVGGPLSSERNIISGSSRSDLYCNGSRNKFVGNYVGTDSTGRVKLSDTGYWQVALEGGSPNNTIQGNVIAGGIFAGIMIYDTGTSYNEVVGNYLGIDASGTTLLGNGASMIVNQPFNRIGGKTPSESNVLTGNLALQSGATDNVIIGNYVGTDATATRTVGSGAIGIDIQSSHNFVGGSTAANGNIVAGQVSLSAGASQNVVAGNYIGTDAASTKLLVGTYFNGIALNAAEHNSIHGNTTLGSGTGIQLNNQSNFNWVRANRISNSTGSGVEIAQADSNRIEGNAFLNNAVNAKDAGNNNRWDDGTKGNYWSDYSGIDANGDKIGDTSRLVPANGIDRFPLIADPFSQALLSVFVSGAGVVNDAVTSSPAGINCRATCSATFSVGTTVTLLAGPTTASTFSGWSGSCSGAGSCTVTITGNKNVTANYVPSGADCLFNWAERSVPQYFSPAGAASITLNPYYYRYYPATGNFLASSSTDNHIWVLGPSFGVGPLDVGPLSGFLGTAGCSR